MAKMLARDGTKVWCDDAILVALLRAPKRGLTVAELAEATGYGPTAVRNNLRALNNASPYWRQRGLTVQGHGTYTPIRYTLTTPVGRERAQRPARRVPRT